MLAAINNTCFRPHPSCAILRYSLFVRQPTVWRQLDCRQLDCRNHDCYHGHVNYRGHVIYRGHVNEIVYATTSAKSRCGV